jgi:hypothetical protein
MCYYAFSWVVQAWLGFACAWCSSGGKSNLHVGLSIAGLDGLFGATALSVPSTRLTASAT